MAVRTTLLALAALALVSAAGVAAQNNETATRVGAAGSTSQSQQSEVPGGGGCKGFSYQALDEAGKQRTPGFNYTSYLGVPTALPEGCKLTDLTITKQYTYKSCPDTRANNYAVASLGITNKCPDEIQTASDTSCNNVIAQAPDDAIATKGIGQSDEIDSGNNSCSNAISVTIKTTTNTYAGSCSNSEDTDDGGDDAGGPTEGGGGGLSKGAKAGIAIGVIVGVILIAVAAWFFCCQLRK